MHRTTSIIALLQSFLIIAGYLAVGIVLKFAGYPDAPLLHWNPLAVFLKQHGLALLTIPTVWTAWSLYTVRKDHGIFSCRLARILGLILIAGILLGFLFAAFDPYQAIHLRHR